jgi:hypothetical protein
VLDEEELGPFGLIHAYWLQKFFGYERDSSGLFVKCTDVWGKTDSWAETIATSPRLVQPGIDPAIEKLARRQFVQRVDVLRRTFEAVRALARATRGGAAPTTAPIRRPTAPRATSGGNTVAE